LRIISGFAKGRKLFSPPAKSTLIRPTSDRAREALFNILGRFVEDAKVLDLFAGTGAIGLEAFSRGASAVLFIDREPLAIALIQKNANLCLASHHGSTFVDIQQQDLGDSRAIQALSLSSPGQFDLIFADPPYNSELSLSILDAIDKSQILAEKGKLIIEERFNISLPARLSRLILVDKRKYGENGFWFYQFADT
jgi:16S rRNA (guanine966-N2)-methyltransferase